MRYLAIILSIGAAGTAAAVEPWTTVATSMEVSRQAGAARWVSWTNSATRERCAPPDSGFIEGTDRDFFNCLSHTLNLRNEAAVPMQCQLSLELTAPNYKGHSREGEVIVIFPNGHRWLSSMGPTNSLIKSHAVTCVAIPEEPAPLIVAAGCQVEVKPRDIDDFYPVGAVRLQKEGTVQVEYATVVGRQWSRDVQVVRSSGFGALDEAALRYMRSLRVSSNCPEQRFRYDVVFKLTPVMRDMYHPQVDQ